MVQVPTATNEELQEIARNVRRNIVRMTNAAKSGHPGGSLSSVEILTALYFRIMRHDPKSPSWPDRDRFVLSKGHATPLMYSVLAEAGYIDPDDLLTFRQLGTKLQGHTIMGKPPLPRYLPIIKDCFDRSVTHVPDLYRGLVKLDCLFNPL